MVPGYEEDYEHHVHHVSDYDKEDEDNDQQFTTQGRCKNKRTRRTSSTPRRREEVVYIDSEDDNIATEKEYGQVQAEIYDRDSTDKQCQAQDQRKEEEQTGGIASSCTEHPNEGNPTTAKKQRKWKTPERNLKHM